MRIGMRTGMMNVSMAARIVTDVINSCRKGPEHHSRCRNNLSIDIQGSPANTSHKSCLKETFVKTDHSSLFNNSGPTSGSPLNPKL